MRKAKKIRRRRRDPFVSTRLSLLTVLVAIALVAASLVPATASAAGAVVRPGDGEERPQFKKLRFQEDWSVLANSGRAGVDELKYIELSDGGTVWLSLGGQVRERIESWTDFAFGAPANHDDIYLLSRFFAHADLHIGEHWRVFVEAKTALASGRDLPGGRRSLEADYLDLQNGFVEYTTPIAGGTLSLRGGREELLLGKQRLVSPLDWSNTRRTFEGGSAHLASGPWKATAFFTKPVIIELRDFNEAGDNEFYGIYLNRSCSTTSGVDVYAFGLDNETATFNGSSGREERYTIGTRGYGASGANDIDAEVAYQFGDLGTGDISAYMGSVELGRKVEIIGNPGRLALGVDYASGDDRAGDGDVETFNQLFPLGHAFLGFIDFVGRQNIAAARLTGTVTLAPGLVFRADLHHFRRAEEEDALYNAGGSVVRAGSPGSAKEVGTEVDLTLTKVLCPYAKVALGLSRLFTGDFIEQTGPAKDITFGYLSLELTL